MREPANLPQQISRDEAHQIAVDAYIYGYPLVLMDVMRRAQTSVPFPNSHSAPINRFAHERFLPGPHYKGFVRPHADGVASSAWLDLSDGPIVLNIPATDRYYLLSAMSAWHE